jgi:hypothetical protein
MSNPHYPNAGTKDTINSNLYVQQLDRTPLEFWITAKPNQLYKKLDAISNKVKKADKRKFNKGNNAQG